MMINEATVTALKICFWILVGFFSYDSFNRMWE